MSFDHEQMLAFNASQLRTNQATLNAIEQLTILGQENRKRILQLEAQVTMLQSELQS